MTSSNEFIPASPGTIRGPHRTSPGNQLKWQYAVKTEYGGWIVKPGNDLDSLKKWAQKESASVKAGLFNLNQQREETSQ